MKLWKPPCFNQSSSQLSSAIVQVPFPPSPLSVPIYPAADQDQLLKVGAYVYAPLLRLVDNVPRGHCNYLLQSDAYGGVAIGHIGNLSSHLPVVLIVVEFQDSLRIGVEGAAEAVVH
jgi:hypothetical protein